MNRRHFLLGSFAAAAELFSSAFATAASPDPWSSSDLMQPAELVKRLQSKDLHLHILCVTFPILYRQKHIPGSQFAGPGAKPEGIAKLHAAVEHLSKDAPLVIYCGCCPMPQCPNIRPAYRALRELGFNHIRVLNLPNNFHTDWVTKGYPVES
jgi:thiosulfate/3-mercaptopyruvate sulfurtransferase